jgi:plastocyanin
MKLRWHATWSLFCVATMAGAMLQAEEAPMRLAIRNHRFEPPELVVPAGLKVRIVVENLDATAEEFESYELNREKVVPGNGSVTIFVGPLAPGRYPFFGDFHRDTAQGVIVAK